MAKSKVSGGVTIDWETEHRDGSGKLISRQARVEPPTVECPQFSCLWKYTAKAFLYILLKLYHKYRVDYAEKCRRKEIPEKYRTGEPSPLNTGRAIWEILKLRLRS